MNIENEKDLSAKKNEIGCMAGIRSMEFVSYTFDMVLIIVCFDYFLRYLCMLLDYLN